jgi:hypothetical protein
MAEWHELSRATIVQIAKIAEKVNVGKADPDDARLLLHLFCERADTPHEIPQVLLRHLRDAFRSYLSGARTLQAALGLARNRGQPEADEERQQRLALEVLRHRLAGLSLEEAVVKVSEESSALLEAWGYKKRSLGETQIRDSWSANKLNALLDLCIERAADGYPWPLDEVRRLTAIFGDQGWVVAPEKSPNKPA